MWREVSDYVHSLGLDAYLVGGAVRDALLGRPHKDQDFVVPGMGYEELRDALAPHGKVEPLEVAGQRVGLRLYPRDPRARELAPGGIEFAPPRTERSTGPGRHDFEIVASPEITLEDDMRRRDFTINAIAKRLADSAIVDPFGGRVDLDRRVLRTVSPRSFEEDPLRIVRGLRFVSELDLDPTPETLAQMREHAPQISLVSGERLGGGLSADGMGELSRLLMGANPAKALRLARDTGVLVRLVPEYRAAVGLELAIDRQYLPLDDHHFAVVDAAAREALPLAVRLALLVHDLGKTRVRGSGHASESAAIAREFLARLRYPARLTRRVVDIVRYHDHPVTSVEPVEARRALARFGAELALDLAAHKIADVQGKRVPDSETDSMRRWRDALRAELTSPHRVADLAIDGEDLLELGVAHGRRVGALLDELRDVVVEDPSLNTRERLLEEARRRL